MKDQTRLVSIDEFHQRAILFPLDKSATFEKHLKLVLEDLPTIDEKLLEYIEKKYPRRLESIKRLLKDLGISESRNVRRIYSNHILPIISDEMQWSSKSDAILIAYVVFIYKELYSPQPEHFASEMEKLKSKLIVKTREGKFVRINADEIVHLTSLYGCQMSLEVLNLPHHRFTFISDDYLKQYQKELFYQDREKNRFRSFLNELDLQDFFVVKREDKGKRKTFLSHARSRFDCSLGFINVDQLADSQWSHLIVTLSPLIFEPFIIQNYCCDEFDALITSKDNIDPNQYTFILLYLDYCFKFIPHYYSASVIKSRERHTGSVVPVQGVESSFCLALRKHPWIPVAGGQLLKPEDVYILPSGHPFRRYVSCLDPVKIPLKNPGFIQLLGFKQEILPMTMLELFMKWSCQLETDELHQLIETSNV